jgi:hypothetical protein
MGVHVSAQRLDCTLPPMDDAAAMTDSPVVDVARRSDVRR